MTTHESWQILACCSRQGAQHRRRGTPGQDSVAQWAGASGDGERVRVLALADGQGLPLGHQSIRRQRQRQRWWQGFPSRLQPDLRRIVLVSIPLLAALLLALAGLLLALGS